MEKYIPEEKIPLGYPEELWSYISNKFWNVQIDTSNLPASIRTKFGQENDTFVDWENLMNILGSDSYEILDNNQLYKIKSLERKRVVFVGKLNDLNEIKLLSIKELKTVYGQWWTINPTEKEPIILFYNQKLTKGLSKISQFKKDFWKNISNILEK